MIKGIASYTVTTIVGVACLGLLALCMARDTLKGRDTQTPQK